MSNKFTSVPVATVALFQTNSCVFEKNKKTARIEPFSTDLFVETLSRHGVSLPPQILSQRSGDPAIKHLIARWKTRLFNASDFSHNESWQSGG